MHDVLIIGGGVIGLSLAWDLARHGQSVQVIDRQEPGREASWAGAGILPAANRATALHSYDQLCGLASELHPQWAAELQSLTGIDTGYRRCGGIYLARTPGEAAALAAWVEDQRELGIEVERVAAENLPPRYSVLRTRYRVPSRFQPFAYHLPQESQLRNPRHLQALLAACKQSGVEITPHFEAGEIVIDNGRIDAVEANHRALRARQFCFTAGAWTGQLLAQLGMPIHVLPLRGQMLLFNTLQRDGTRSVPTTSILNEGSRYIVPRDDGRVLVGSTEEEAGFDQRTTEEGLADLAAFAREIVPQLADAPIERSWAGLRPASFDGLPYLGLLPGLTNAFVAAGHFRSGLYLSPATAVVMSELMRGHPTEIDLAPFRVGR
jgi:glycine oxidase